MLKYLLHISIFSHSRSSSQPARSQPGLCPGNDRGVLPQPRVPGVHVQPVQRQLGVRAQDHHLRAAACQEDQGRGAQPQQLHQGPGRHHHHCQANATVSESQYPSA